MSKHNKHSNIKNHHLQFILIILLIFQRNKMLDMETHQIKSSQPEDELIHQHNWIDTMFFILTYFLQLKIITIFFFLCKYLKVHHKIVYGLIIMI